MRARSEAALGFTTIAALLAVVALAPRAAFADEPAAASDEGAPQATSATSGVQLLGGQYSTFLHGPLAGRRATAFVGGGRDSAAPEWRAAVQGWIPVYGRFSLIGGAAYRGATDAWRPFVGVAVALLEAKPTGTSVDLLAQFKTEGFSEPEGEIELTVRAGHRFHRASLTFEGSYGQDPEAAERDGELAADASFAAGRFSFGLGARARRDLGGSKVEAIRWDVQAGPHLGLVVTPGNFVGVATGVSALELDGQVMRGVFGVASYALAY
jgi:hypothetical protein